MNSLVLLFLLLFGVHGDPNSPTKTAEEVVLQMQIDAGRIECLYQTITDPKHVALELGKRSHSKS
jgi:hypothetical protein